MVAGKGLEHYRRRCSPQVISDDPWVRGCCDHVFPRDDLLTFYLGLRFTVDP